MQKIDRQVAFTGTKDVAEPLRFDPARLEAYLAREVRGFAGPLTVQQFKGGQSNPTYMLETPSRKYVLRRKPPGKLLPSAHAVDREFRVIQGLAGAGLPGRRAGDLLRRRERHRHGVLRDGLRRRPRVLESGDAGLEPARSAPRSMTR